MSFFALAVQIYCRYCVKVFKHLKKSFVSLMITYACNKYLKVVFCAADDNFCLQAITT